MPRKKAVKTAKKVDPQPKKFNLFDSDIVDSTQEALAALNARKKNRPVTIRSLSSVPRYLMDHGLFALDMTFGTRGFRGKTAVEFIGGEGIGKTTFVMTLLGGLMKNNQSPVLYVNTEGDNKLPNKERIMRCLDTDPNTAERILNVLEIDTGRELRRTTEYIEDFIRTTRKYLDGRGAEDVPIVVVIDTLSKMMSPGEAAGVLDDGEDNKKAKELGGGSNFEFAKLMHAWCRQLPTILDTYNVLLIAVSHQNQKIDMSGFGSPMSADVSAGYNKNKYGGKALDQNAVLQCTIKRIGFAKNSKGDTIGHKIQLRVVKSSVGADNSTLDYVLKTRDFNDYESYQEPALDFSGGLANVFAEQKLLGTTVARKRYTSDELGVSGVTSQEFMEALHARPDIMSRLGHELKIEGYTSKEVAELQSYGEDDPESEAEESVEEQEE